MSDSHTARRKPPAASIGLADRSGPCKGRADKGGSTIIVSPDVPTLYTIRPCSEALSGFRLLAGDAAEAVRLARQMEDRGLVVEIVDPGGIAHPPDALDVGPPVGAGPDAAG